MRYLAGAGALALFAAMPLAAADVVCPDAAVTVRNGAERAPAMCAAAAHAVEQLASCNLPDPPALTIEIAQSLPPNCHGIYYCDARLIQFKPLDAYAAYLADHSDGLFGHLSTQVFFDSLIRHEMAHAALDALPCPFDGCPATQEFVAYTMQIHFLPAPDRAVFDLRAAQRDAPVTADSLNALKLMMSPETFIADAYAYLRQARDPCEVMAQIARGDLLFDYAHP